MKDTKQTKPYICGKCHSAGAPLLEWWGRLRGDLDEREVISKARCLSHGCGNEWVMLHEKRGGVWTVTIWGASE